MFISKFFQRNKLIITLFIIVFTFVLKGFTQSNKTNIDSNENLDFLKFTHNGIWSWFSDPRAVKYNEKIYTGWVDNFGDIYIASYDLKTQTIHSKVVYHALEIDDHNNPSILVDSLGYLHVFFTTHIQDEKPIYYIKSSQSESILNWETLRTINLNDKDRYTNARSLNHTYTNPIQLKENDSTIYLFWRGINYLPSYSKSNDLGKTWSKGRIIFDPIDSDEKIVPYTKVYSNGKHKIHFTFTDAHPKSHGINSLYYAYYENGNFYKANGKLIKGIDELPLKTTELDVIYASKTTDVWNWDIAEDKNGNPVIGFATFEGANNHIYNYSKFHNGKWVNRRLINSGNWFPKDQNLETQPEPYYSGGMTINHTDPNTIYLSIKKNNVFEIEKWITKNDGEDWNKTPITKNSKTHNIRPYAIKNSSANENLNLLWVTIENYIYYGLQSKQIKSFKDRYKSSIYSNLPSKKVNRKFNTINVLQFLNTLHNAIIANPKSFTELYDIKFNMFYEASRELSEVSKNVIIINELQNLIEITGEDIEVEDTSDEVLLWCSDAEENRRITVRLSELDIEGFDIVSNAYQFILLTRLIDLNVDSIVTTSAKKHIETALKSENQFKWLDQNSTQANANTILENSIILYSKLWLHNNGFLKLDSKKLSKEAEILYKLAVKQYHNNSELKDVKTMSLFTLAMTDFVIFRNTF